MSRESAPTSPRSGWTALVFGLVIVWLCCEFLWSAHTPFLSEDWTHMAEMRAVPTIFGALDPHLEPLRPLQHAFFWLLAHCGSDPTGAELPLVAHAAGFALHAVACWIVYLLARAAGASQRGALVALALFAVFPNVKSIAWSAAIGSPGRVCFELAALLLFVQHAHAPSAKRGATAVSLFACALAWHESAMLLPAVLALWIVFVDADSIRDGLRRSGALARDPWIRVLIVGVLVYGVSLLLRTQRHHQVKSFDALPANVVKASTALWPEDARAFVIDGFRGADGSSPWIASVVFGALALSALVISWRSRRARFVIFACTLDLGLPALGTGFVQRYAYLASAFVAIGLGLWVARNGGVLRSAIVVGVAALWAHDAYVDARDYQDLSRAVPKFVTVLRQLRATNGPDVHIALVDPPDMFGAERDIPVYNWGLDFMLEANHVDGPWSYWRTGPSHTSTNVEWVDPLQLEHARKTGTPRLHACALSTQ